MTVRLLSDGYPHADVSLARLLDRAEGAANAGSVRARARQEPSVESGAAFAMMVAAPGSASQRNAERQGFRVAYTRTKWALPQDGGGS